MSDLLLPPNVVAEIQKQEWAERRARFRAKLDALLDFDDPVCRQWNPHLRELDPLLRMGRARPMAYEPGWAIVPNYYHWVRDNPTAPPSVTPITGPDEEWAEPDSRVLDMLRRNDLQNPLVFAAMLEQYDRQQKAEEKQEQVEDEERQREILERWQAASRVQVSTNRDSPWTQNMRGRRES